LIFYGAPSRARTAILEIGDAPQLSPDDPWSGQETKSQSRSLGNHEDIKPTGHNLTPNSCMGLAVDRITVRFCGVTEKADHILNSATDKYSSACRPFFSRFQAMTVIGSTPITFKEG
jgi:hypothetical protein